MGGDSGGSQRPREACSDSCRLEMGSRVCKLHCSKVGRGPVRGCPSLEEDTVTLSNLMQVVLQW